MKQQSVNILCHQDINGALNRYITSTVFESRIMEHPQQAMERTSFLQNSQLTIEKRTQPVTKK